MSLTRLCARSLACALAVIFLFAARIVSAQNTINVPAGQPTIQAGINAANNGDTVLVAPGTYSENINFMGKLITVTSSGGPSVTIIDGGRAAPVVMFNHGESTSAVLKGFTIQNGNTQIGLPGDGNGGGISIAGASPTVSGNIIQNNFACGSGGGIAETFGSPVIQGNTIQNNTQPTNCEGLDGGGVFLGGAGSAQLIGNIIINNTCPTGDGGGVKVNAAGTPTISNNLISGNLATGLSPASRGGGITLFNHSDALIVQNLIYNNSSGQGGGVWFLVPLGYSGPILINNTIFGNSASTGQGSAVYAAGFDDQVQFFNNLVIAQAGQSAVFCDASYQPLPPAFSNNDAFSSNGLSFDGACVGQVGPNGNISIDPQFVNPSTGDFHLQPFSPVVDAGTNAVANLPKTDYDGNPRTIDGNNDCVSIVDMGAYEFVRAAKVSFSSSSLSFPAQVIGTSSSGQNVTLTNNGTTCFQFSSTQITGDFSQASNCAAAGLPAGSSCFYDVTFTPTASGLRTGALKVTGTDGGTTNTPSVNLSGTGLTPAAVLLSATSLGFGLQPVGTRSADQTVTLTNTGQTSLSVLSIGTGSPFFQTNNCPSTLASGVSCIINVTFTPGASGAQAGTLSISDNATGSPQSVALNGTGVDFSVSANPASTSVKHGSSTKITIQVNPVGGAFNSAVGLSCSGLPGFSTCSFSPLSITPGASGASSVLTLATSARTPRGTFNVSVIGAFGSLQHSTTIVLTVK